MQESGGCYLCFFLIPLLRYDSPNLTSRAVFARSVFWSLISKINLDQILRYPAKICIFIPNFACSLCTKKFRKIRGDVVNTLVDLTWNDPVISSRMHLDSATESI